AAVEVAEDADEEVTLGHLAATEVVCLVVAGAEVLHAHAAEAVEAGDRPRDRLAELCQVPGRGAEEDGGERHGRMPAGPGEFGGEAVRALGLAFPSVILPGRGSIVHSFPPGSPPAAGPSTFWLSPMTRSTMMEGDPLPCCGRYTSTRPAQGETSW